MGMGAGVQEGKVIIKNCQGHCCKDLQLEQSPEELREHFLQWEKLQEEKKQLFNQLSRRGKMKRVEFDRISKSTIVNGKALYKDIHIIYPMLIFKYKGFWYDNVDTGVAYHYTCKHYDEKRKCTIYEIRPEVCSIHPHGGQKCQYDGCTLEIEKEIMKAPVESKREMFEVSAKEDIILGTHSGHKMYFEKKDDAEKYVNDHILPDRIIDNSNIPLSVRARHNWPEKRILK
jgi:Fe-S-cluster containining protein